jgi:hypothetical protein
VIFILSIFESFSSSCQDFDRSIEFFFFAEIFKSQLLKFQNELGSFTFLLAFYGMTNLWGELIFGPNRLVSIGVKALRDGSTFPVPKSKTVYTSCVQRNFLREY